MPQGDVTLVFSVNGVNASVTVSGVMNSDQMVPAAIRTAEVEGTVSGAPAGHACPAFSVSVGSTAVTTSAATKFDDVTCAAVVSGIRVEVKGTRTPANAIAATKVEKK